MRAIAKKKILALLALAGAGRIRWSDGAVASHGRGPVAINLCAVTGSVDAAGRSPACRSGASSTATRLGRLHAPAAATLPGARG